MISLYVLRPLVHLKYSIATENASTLLFYGIVEQGVDQDKDQ